MAVSQVNHPPGKGWKTFAQVAAAMPRVGKQRIYRWLREEIAAGRMEAYRGSALNAVGRVSQQVWYRRRQRVRSPRQPAPGSTDP
ncbi:MAG: hypothetical protein D6781_14305 [Verrucomicrobia bacterium]|nr:MAG: hypothetical protein D6781_14305 [Verrucomicrobiota bacterium]